MGLPKLAESLGKMPPAKISSQQGESERSGDLGRSPGELGHSSSDLEQVRQELLSGAAGLAASARRVMRWQAVLCWLAVGLTALLMLLLADVLLRREELGLRILALAAWLVLLVWSARKLLRPAWQFSLTPVQAAQWLERQQPELGYRQKGYREQGSLEQGSLEQGNQLSTAVELAGLSASDTRYGSNRFREAALRQWADHGPSINWSGHLQQRGMRRARGLLIIACGLLAAAVLVWPSEMRVALARFTVPWGDNAWPRRDQLQIVHLPTVIAEGSELQLEVIDQRPPLPETIQLQVRGIDSTDSASMRAFETTSVGELAVGNLPAMNAAFEVRAVGGDDESMAWRRVEVVQPPELSEFQFAVQPPPYTGLARSEIIGRRISVLAGSQVEFNGRFDRPVARVAVQLAEPAAQATAQPAADTDNEPTAAEQTGVAAQQAWSVTLSDGGRALHLGAAQTAMLDMQQPLNWQLLISTADGLEVLLRERWSIEVTADEPPRVIFQTADLSELASDAQLRLRGEASDDLGLVEVRGRLQLSGSDAADAATLPIWQATAVDSLADMRIDEPDAPLARSSSAATASGVPSQVLLELSIDAVWEIARAGKFVAGQRVAVWLEARDSADQWNQSQIQYYEIRESDELIESIQARQSQLLTQVRELVDTQRRNAQLFSRTWEQTQQQGQILREQLDPLRNAAQVQRAVAERLGSSNAQGLSQEIAKLRELLQANRLTETPVAGELQDLAASAESLSQGPLADATQATRHTAALAEAALAEDANLDESLVRSAEQTVVAQETALRAMEGLLDRLARNESLQQATAELAQILNQQNAIRSETDRLQLANLSSKGEASSAELQAEQAALSSDQQGLARRLDDWLDRSSELQAQSDDQKKNATEALARATQSLLTAQASAQMRRSTEEIRDQQLARAAVTQQQVSELLAQSLRQMGAGSPSQLGSLRSRADGLRQLSNELSQLAKSQAELSERWQGPPPESELEQLISQQAEAQQRTSGLAQQAEQSGSASLAAEINQASAAQRRAQQAGEQNEFQQAEQASREAAEQLAKTSAQLEQRAAALERQAAEQQMVELAAALDELTEKQQPISEQFSQWVDAAADSSSESRQQQQADMRQAASQQEAVRQALRELRGETSALPVFGWTLQQSESAMGRAVASAQRYRIKPDAQQAADRALRLLRLAADAMRPDRAAERSPENSSSTDDDAQRPDSADPSQAEEPAEPPAPMLASLKLLRNLQQELNEQTRAAEASDDAVERTGQLGELARLQQELAAQVEQLSNSQP